MSLKAQSLSLNDMFFSSSLEDFLAGLYKASGRREKIKSVVLCGFSAGSQPMQYIQQKKGFYEQKAKPWPSGLSSRFNEEKDREYLALCLGRPAGKVFAFPLEFKKSNLDKPALLFIEGFSLKQETCEAFFKFIQPFLIKKLDRLLLEEDLQKSCRLWAGAFEEFKEPLAICTAKGEISAKNSAFQEIKLSAKQDGRIYKQKTYPVFLAGELYKIYHAENITNFLFLRGKMIQNQKMSALEDLGESIAHELNNPLAGILSMAQMILNTQGLEESFKKDIKLIAGAATRAGNIISHLLDFSRLKEKLILCDLKIQTENTLKLLKSMTADVEFEMEWSTAPVLVKAEPCLLQQVIFNLVKNACQALEGLKYCSKKIKISIFVKNDRAFLKVEDNGQGIAEKDFENIFKIFFTTKNKNQGAGIGLHFSRRTIESFNGALFAGSSSLGGAGLTLELPLQYSLHRFPEKNLCAC